MNNVEKRLIHQRFAKNLSSYQQNAIIQKKMAENLVENIKKYEINFDKILELGSGVGTLTNVIEKEFNFSQLTLVDIVENSKDYHKNRKNTKIIIEDMDNLKLDEKFNLIISNATIQWSENLEDLCQKLASMLEKNGLVALSTFGIENLLEIKYSNPTPKLSIGFIFAI